MASTSRRAALIGAFLPLPLHALPAGAVEVGDMRLLELAQAIRGAETKLEALFTAVSSFHGTPQADALEDEAEGIIDHQADLVAQLASLPASGALGLSAKSIIVASAVARGFSLEEQDLAQSLRRDVQRLFPAIREVL